MDRYLVTLSLGPVQSLIGAARVTRDLWCGSWLLSEAARAAARVLHTHQPGCLIFPCLADSATELKPRDWPGDTASFANILRAEIALPDAAAVRALCEKAKDAATSQIAVLGEAARSKMEKQGTHLQEEVWRAQTDDILEVYSAWVSIQTAGDYSKASQLLGAALAARKATRDFQACKPLATEGLPKSSLDGARETVLPVCLKDNQVHRKHWLSDGEQLDALGFIKRTAGNSEQFTAISRIASDSWIEQLTPEQQQTLNDAYAPLVKLGWATQTQGNKGIYGVLPFDAMLLYGFRMENALLRSTDENERGALRNLKKRIKQIFREKSAVGSQLGEPVPYVAVLKADGDRMGALLSKTTSADQARNISSAMHNFASNVHMIARVHRGHAIYAGGDDALALTPLLHARKCSDALAREFADTLGPIAAEMGVPADERPTLSVGLGIGHVMEPLGEHRARSERAESLAKEDIPETARNALAIVLGVRSGAEVCWRAQWNDDLAFGALDQMISGFRNGALPSRVAYDIRDIDRRLAWLRDDESDRANGMRGAEVGRMLDRARIRGGTKQIPDELKELIIQRAQLHSLKELAETLIVARWLSARTKGDLGEGA